MEWETNFEFDYTEMGEDFSHDLSWWKYSELDKKKCFGICITD